MVPVDETCTRRDILDRIALLVATLARLPEADYHGRQDVLTALRCERQRLELWDIGEAHRKARAGRPSHDHETFEFAVEPATDEERSAAERGMSLVDPSEE